ncbi:MAG: hypothetical protein ACE5FT_06890 [Candidatus Nanoarchaeia archaeon]
MEKGYKALNLDGFKANYARFEMKYGTEKPKGLKTPDAYVAAFDALVGQYEELSELYGGDTEKMRKGLHAKKIYAMAKTADALLGGNTGLVKEDGVYDTENIYEILQKGQKALKAALADNTLANEVEKQDLTKKTACA